MRSARRVFLALALTAVGAEWVAEPIPLFLNSSGTTFELQPEGLAFLAALGEVKLSIISVGGQARAGKSFLLNNLLNASHCTSPPCAAMNARGVATGFGVGSSFNACTKGVWLWGQPTFKTVDGERVAVIYMDTEGLGAMGNVRDNQDPKLALFSALFSSSFYYVVHRVINQESIDFLHSVAVFSQKVGRDLGSSAGAGADASPFPFASLFWVVQSAELCESAGGDSDEDGDGLLARARCAESMVATALTPKDEGSAPAEVVERYNDVVSLVTTRFAQLPPGAVRALAMTHPKTFICPENLGKLRAAGASVIVDAGVKKCRKLRGAELPHVPYELLDAGYREQVSVLGNLMVERAVPKSLGVPLTGRTFGALATRVIGYFNSFNGTVDRGILTEFAEAVAEEASALFDVKLQQGLLPQAAANGSNAEANTEMPMTVHSQAAVVAIGETARAASLAHFDQRCPGGDPSSRLNSRVRSRLATDIAHALERAAATHAAAARTECQRTLASGFASRVGKQALGGDGGGGAFASQQAYANAKASFKAFWLGGCALPAADAAAMWGDFERTHVSLHDAWVARDAGRSAVRGLRRSLVRGAGYSTVTATAASALLPHGSPRWARLAMGAAVLVRNLFVGGALALTASDLNLAPELIDGAAVEAALAEVAPRIGALLSAADMLRARMDGALAVERAVRGSLLGSLFEGMLPLKDDHGKQQQQQQQQQQQVPSFSVLQNLLVLILEALVMWVAVTYGPGYLGPRLEQARIKAEERQRQREQDQQEQEGGHDGESDLVAATTLQADNDPEPATEGGMKPPELQPWSVKVSQPRVVHSPAPLAWHPASGRPGHGSSSKKKQRRFAAKRVGLQNSFSPARGSPLANISNSPSFFPSSNIKSSPVARPAAVRTSTSRRTTMRLG
jgi:hypothetical protein